MPKPVIKNFRVVEDDWQLVTDQELPASGKVIVPLAMWQENRASLQQQFEKVAVWLDSVEPPALIAEDLPQLELVAINFPVFADGRGYSYARELVSRYNFPGEIRAIGDVLRDQMFYMKRCGFNAFDVRPDRDIHAALESLEDFSETYQASVDQPKPLFIRRQQA